MATKTFEVQGIGLLTIRKSKKSRNLRLSIKHDNAVIVSIPYWVPYKAGLDYAKSKKDWIISNMTEKSNIEEGTRIGKAHRVTFKESITDKVSSRLTNNEIIILYPPWLSRTSREVQIVANRTALRALKKEADVLLEQRLRRLAQLYEFKYNSLKIRSLKTRWGSCSNNKDITLSYYLIQLPWDEIDYVIIHELVHTKYMAHNRQFWDEVHKYVPNMDEIKRKIKVRKPTVSVV
ncbi:M48 family metallopeptidase [Candidatus Saccharibacteria bacterium]|nr:M48 family metallopeptidase [Candidatus Saccharibacteria bacterium]